MEYFALIKSDAAPLLPDVKKHLTKGEALKHAFQWMAEREVRCEVHICSLRDGNPYVPQVHVIVAQEAASAFLYGVPEGRRVWRSYNADGTLSYYGLRNEAHGHSLSKYWRETRYGEGEFPEWWQK